MVATVMGSVAVRQERFEGFGGSVGSVPQVSVIIPARNAAATLSYSLASLARQSMPAWEAIIVDDGSEDGTLALAISYGAHDDRIRVVRQYTRGASVARNRGVTEAAADWLLFLDPGDELEPHALEQLLRAAARDASVSVIHGGWAQLANDGTRVDEGAPRPDGDDLFDLLARESAFPVHACMIRRILVQAAGGWDATLSFGEDWDMWQRVARMGVRFGATRARVALSRARGRRGAASATPNRMLADGVRVLRRGHAPDPRVCSPSPRHVQGRSADPTPNLYHFACWCAGRLLAAGDDARVTLDALGDVRFPALDAAVVADAILRGAHAAVPELAARPSALRSRLIDGLGVYLVELERKSGAPRLATAARATLEVRLTAAERLSPRASLV